MLYVKRDVNQSILIGKDIKIRLMMIEGTRALIGIDAPKSIPVYRQEIYQRQMDLMNITKCDR